MIYKTRLFLHNRLIIVAAICYQLATYFRICLISGEERLRKEEETAKNDREEGERKEKKKETENQHEGGGGEGRTPELGFFRPKKPSGGQRKQWKLCSEFFRLQFVASPVDGVCGISVCPRRGHHLYLLPSL